MARIRSALVVAVGENGDVLGDGGMGRDVLVELLAGDRGGEQRLDIELEGDAAAGVEPSQQRGVQLADPPGLDSGQADDRRPRRVQERAGARLEIDFDPEGVAEELDQALGVVEVGGPRIAAPSVRAAAADQDRGDPVRLGDRRGADAREAAPRRSALGRRRLGQVDASRLEDREAIRAPGEVVGGDGEQPADQVGAHHRLVGRQGVVHPNGFGVVEPLDPAPVGIDEAPRDRLVEPGVAEQVLEPPQQLLVALQPPDRAAADRAGSPADARRGRGSVRPPRSGRPRG